jgi:hypothetical protein
LCTVAGEIANDFPFPMMVIDDAKAKMCLARWFFEMGNTDAMFAYCFLVLTWNLMCWANNTTCICVCFLHLLWQWDSAIISFAQQKADQMGLTEKFPRNLYANPVDYLLCPIFALAVYLATFGTAVDPNSRLFPVESQYKRFCGIMQRVLRDHEDEVLAMGYGSISKIGTHSIWKGAIKFISGQPGSPSAMSVCIRGGWTFQ